MTSAKNLNGKTFHLSNLFTLKQAGNIRATENKKEEGGWVRIFTE